MEHSFDCSSSSVAGLSCSIAGCSPCSLVTAGCPCIIGLQDLVADIVVACCYPFVVDCLIVDQSGSEKVFCVSDTGLVVVAAVHPLGCLEVCCRSMNCFFGCLLVFQNQYFARIFILKGHHSLECHPLEPVPYRWCDPLPNFDLDQILAYLSNLPSDSGRATGYQPTFSSQALLQ